MLVVLLVFTVLGIIGRIYYFVKYLY